MHLRSTQNITKIIVKMSHNQWLKLGKSKNTGDKYLKCKSPVTLAQSRLSTHLTMEK